MRYLVAIGVLCAVVGGIAQADEPQKAPLNVLYLARDDDPDRQESFSSFLKEHFADASVLKRSEFEPAQAARFDVVLVDWSQREDRPDDYPSPLGDLENWSTPTVMLGSAGLIMAGPWQVIGGAG